MPLASLGLERHQYIEATGEPQAEAYEDYYAESSHLAHDDIDAVIGGWHELWAGDDFYLPLEMRLALLTLRDAEPWYELMRSAGLGTWRVREHIT